MNLPRVSVWPTLSPAVHLRRARPGPPPFPLAEPGCRVHARARHGLHRAVTALGWRPGDEILVPAYHHGSEIEALARTGATCRFYRLDRRLAPDEAHLDQLLGPRVRALHLTHYLGLLQDSRRWRSWCDARGIALIEDAAQAFLATDGDRSVGALADVAVYCLYKTLPVPDGGAVVARVLPPPSAVTPPRALEGLLRRHGAWLAQRWPAVAALHTRRIMPPGPAREIDDDLGDPDSAPSAATVRLVARLEMGDIAARRRRNYVVLLDQLRDLVPEPFAELPPGSSPFAFPIQLEDKAGALDHLFARGVVGLNFWQHPHPLLPEGFPDVRRLCATVLALPVHQQLRPVDLDRIVAAVRSLPRR